jgi:predicted phage tail protein
MKKSELKKLIKEEILKEDQAQQLFKKIDKAISSIDDSMDYKQFAKAVALELKDQYGSHNFKDFIDTLKKELK